ncbi:hypothetical protein KAU88_09440 [Candidatus Bathyarchaeota archaeon]|nr:hypothetical protein [Candidatus Bathyarchaeota archaeon]
MAITLETRGVFVGVVLCLLGLIVFMYGTNNMTPANAVSNSFLVVIGMFLGMAGLIVLITNVFSGGSIFT